MSRRAEKRVRRPVGRPPGSTQTGREGRRTELARAVLKAVIELRGRPSLHDIARVTGASIPTLKHHFGDRSGAIAAALRTVEADARVHLAAVAEPHDAPVKESLRRMCNDLSTAWARFGVGALFSSGMAAGVADDLAGPGYVDGVLEPTVRAVERRLRVHVERGELRISQDDLTLRTAALALLSPLIVALLHQHDLAGVRCRPLDLPAFIEVHVARFLTGYGR